MNDKVSFMKAWPRTYLKISTFNPTDLDLLPTLSSLYLTINSLNYNNKDKAKQTMNIEELQFVQKFEQEELSETTNIMSVESGVKKGKKNNSENSKRYKWTDE